MQEVYRILARLMNTDLGVMITGESGTGKELVARALHNYGLRKAGPFVAINMAAIPREATCPPIKGRKALPEFEEIMVILLILRRDFDETLPTFVQNSELISSLSGFFTFQVLFSPDLLQLLHEQTGVTRSFSESLNFISGFINLTLFFGA